MKTENPFKKLLEYIHWDWIPYSGLRLSIFSVITVVEYQVVK